MLGYRLTPSGLNSAKVTMDQIQRLRKNVWFANFMVLVIFFANLTFQNSWNIIPILALICCISIGWWNYGKLLAFSCPNCKRYMFWHWLSHPMFSNKCRYCGSHLPAQDHPSPPKMI
jgi:hypothetical protein